MTRLDVDEALAFDDAEQLQKIIRRECERHDHVECVTIINIIPFREDGTI